jgi:hypothetical protein
MGLVIRNTKEDKPRFLRMGIYGNTGVGKTTTASTFPRPFFFSVSAESGISSLASIEKGVDYALIESRRDMEDALQMFKKDYKAKDWRTAVIDTATIYGRFVSMEESRHGEISMDQAKWMKVLGHLLNIRDVLHTCECHVVWIFHVDERKSGDFILGIGPKLVGQANAEIVQTLGLLAYMDRVEIPAVKNDNGETIEEARTVRGLWVRCPAEMSPKFAFKSWYEKVLPLPCYAPDFAVLAKYLAPKYIQSLIDEVKK